MAYKKYIKRGGKIYGPYIYHSKRIDGKVVSEYRGQGKPGYKLSYKKVLLAFLGVVVLAFLIYLLFFSEKRMTGEAVLSLDANYEQGEMLEGKLRLSLQEGELIPASSKLIFESNGNIFEYELKDLVSEELTEGNFYVKGASLSGSGKGYGISGNKEEFPEIYFVLNILSEEEQNTGQEAEQAQAETNESGASQTENTTQEETGIFQTEITEEQKEEQTTTTENQEEETSEEKQETEIQEAPITGNVISRFAGALSNFFLGITMTGNAIIEFEREVNGQVSVNKTFVYELQKGERAELKPLSVRTNSEQLSDTDINIRTEDKVVSVTTDYSESVQGFGEDYLGSKSEELFIDISNLNLILEQGNLKVSIIDSNQEILSLSTVLEEGELSVNKEISDPTTETTEKASEQTLANEISSLEQTETYVPELIVTLTEQEKAALIKEFGNASVKVEEASPIRGFIKVKCELGNHWVEFNYDAHLSNEDLELFKEKDIAKWLKELAKSLLEEPEPEPESKSTEYQSIS